MKRGYSESSPWAFMQVKKIPDMLYPERTYLWRLRILSTPWFGIYLHRINMPDYDRHLHSHPFQFASLILSGGYEEHIPVGNPYSTRPIFRSRVWKRGSIHLMRHGEFHRIMHLHKRPTWTLIFLGPYSKPWGFATPQGWIPYEEYLRGGDYGSLPLSSMPREATR